MRAGVHPPWLNALLTPPTAEITATISALAISGGLRAASLHTALLNEASALAPDGVCPQDDRT